MNSRSILALAVLCWALPAGALLIRADRDDAEYLELASRYTSSVALEAPDGEGVLIAPRWVLTAAHRARAIQEMKPPARLKFAGRDHEIEAVYIHPDGRKGEPNDIALVLLRKDVRGIEPTPIYRTADEGGKTVVIVGHGHTGRIGEAPQPKEKWDRKKRAAINTVDRVSPRTFGLKIKAPDDASDLQGAAAPGDSGGPAYLETVEGLLVAGINYATDDANADGIAGNVGDWDLYMRVSVFAGWIDATLLEVARREADALLGEGRR